MPLAAAEDHSSMRTCAKLVTMARPNKIDVELDHGLKAIPQRLDTIDYGSHVHISYAYVRSYSSSLLFQIQNAQLCHHTIRLRAVRNL